jgi:hypothetical protein
LTELRAYRKAHGTEAAAAHFGITGSRLRQLLPAEKPKPIVNSVFAMAKKR